MAPRVHVVPADLEQLDIVRRILALLNEPAACATSLGELIDQMPVLAARLDAIFRARWGRSSTSGNEIAMIGNRAFEQVLLDLLEDLTVLKSELPPAP